MKNIEDCIIEILKNYYKKEPRMFVAINSIQADLEDDYDIILTDDEVDVYLRKLASRKIIDYKITKVPSGNIIKGYQYNS